MRWAVDNLNFQRESQKYIFILFMGEFVQISMILIRCYYLVSKIIFEKKNPRKSLSFFKYRDQVELFAEVW